MYQNEIITAHNSSGSKVIFSQAYVNHSVHRRGVTLRIRKFQSLYFFKFFSDYNFSHKDNMGNVTTLCE